MSFDKAIDQIYREVDDELMSATERYPPFNTAHEGYAVLLEEMDELWEHVRVTQGCRLTNRMRREAVQVAAMAIRFALDICNTDKGNK